MTTPSWKIDGQYYETCSCDYFCPCLLDFSAAPSKGTCNFAMGYSIESGMFGSTSLDGLGFIVLGLTPEAMMNGNWSVGLLIDDRATPEQRDAIAAIAGGSAGGPMSALGGLIGKFLGAEAASIEFGRDGARWTVKAGDKVDMAGEPRMGINPGDTTPLQISHSGHPAAPVVTVNRALKSSVNALGLNWKDMSGKNSGLSAPFSWRGA